MHNRIGHRFQRRLDVPVWLEPKTAAGIAYSEKVLATQAANLIGYWPLFEESGTNAENLEGTAARDGTYNSDVSTWPVGVGIGDGNTAPTFDGANDFVDVYSVSLNGPFDGDEGSVMIWGLIAAGVWTDGAARDLFQFGAGGNDFIFLRKQVAANELRFLHFSTGGGGSNVQVAFSETSFFQAVITWSVAADEMKAYINGAQVGATQNGLGAWAGALDAQICCLGAADIFANRPVDGGAAHGAIWNAPLTLASVENLATV